MDRFKLVIVTITNVKKHSNVQLYQINSIEFSTLQSFLYTYIFLAFIYMCLSLPLSLPLLLPTTVQQHINSMLLNDLAT